MRHFLLVFCMGVFAVLLGCKTEHKVEVEVKPMQITVDVNIRIDRELDNFFGNLDKEAAKVHDEKSEEQPNPAHGSTSSP